MGGEPPLNEPLSPSAPAHGPAIVDFLGANFGSIIVTPSLPLPPYFLRFPKEIVFLSEMSDFGAAGDFFFVFHIVFNRYFVVFAMILRKLLLLYIF